MNGWMDGEMYHLSISHNFIILFSGIFSKKVQLLAWHEVDR